MVIRKAATQPPKSSFPNRLQIRSLLSIRSCLYELVAYGAHVDDTQPRAVPQAMAQLGDEHLQAAAIAGRVVTPQHHKDVMRFHYPINILDQHPHQLGLSMRQLLHLALPQQLLCDGIKTVSADVHPAVVVFAAACRR